MNREELDKFIGAVISKECTINQLLNINVRNNNILRNENLLYVLNGLFKASGKEEANLTKETLDKLKTEGMLSEEFYGKIESSIKDGKIKLEDVLEMKTSTELTMEQKQEQAKAIQSLEKIKSNSTTEQDLENLSILTNDQSENVSDDLKAKAKDVIAEKANEAKQQNPELQTNSLTNIETYQNLLRPLSPKFNAEPNIMEASTLIESAILEGQLSLGAASKILTEVGFNPADVTDLLKSSNSPSPDFNIDDISNFQATAGDRLIETISILGEKQTELTYEENPDKSPSTQDEPRIAIVKNYINNNLITFEEVKALQENGKLPLNEIELEGIETMSTIDETSAEEISEDLNNNYDNDLDHDDLIQLLSYIDYEMEADTSMVMTKNVN